MRSLIFFMHASLDGFVAGPNGEMNWITVNDEIFDFVDTMMEAYWPEAGKQPNASKHTKEHSVWYSKVTKVVLSKTMSEEGLVNTTVISDDLADNINKIKNQEGKNILIFGSPRASHSLLREGLVDEFWIFLNPILIGQGIPLFKDVPEITKLNLIETKTFACGVIALRYGKERN
jgi:dihydrofolate reductase